MPTPSPVPDDQKDQRMAAVEQLIEKRQEQVQAEQHRQEVRVENLEAVARQEQAGLSQELKLIEEKRQAATVWRKEQKEKKRALALDRLRKQKELEHELEMKAQANALHEKQQAYLDAVHKIAAEKRFKATQKSALREEEVTDTEAARHERMANMEVETRHQISVHDAELRADQRRKELSRGFQKRRSDLELWARRQVMQITGVEGDLTRHDRLTPEQRRRVQKAEQEYAQSLESLGLEERQQMQSLEATLAREKQAADHLFKEKTGINLRAKKQSEELAATKREGIIEIAKVRAENYATFGNKQSDAQKEKDAKAQAAQVAKRQPRGLF